MTTLILKIIGKLLILAFCLVVMYSSLYTDSIGTFFVGLIFFITNLETLFVKDSYDNRTRT